MFAMFGYSEYLKCWEQTCWSPSDMKNSHLPQKSQNICFAASYISSLERLFPLVTFSIFKQKAMAMSTCMVPRSLGLMHAVTHEHLLCCTTNVEILSCQECENNFKFYSNTRNQISAKQFYSFSCVIFQSLAISKFTNSITLSFFIQANFACALSVLGAPGVTHLPCSF